MDIQQEIRMYRQKWITLDKWQDPDVKDCILFLVSEVGEVTDALLRAKQGYHRNNERQVDLSKELAQVVMMATIALDLMDEKLNDVLLSVLDEMDKKRVNDEPTKI